MNLLPQPKTTDGDQADSLRVDSLITAPQISADNTAQLVADISAREFQPDAGPAVESRTENSVRESLASQPERLADEYDGIGWQ